MTPESNPEESEITPPEPAAGRSFNERLMGDPASPVYSRKRGELYRVQKPGERAVEEGEITSTTALRWVAGEDLSQSELEDLENRLLEVEEHRLIRLADFIQTDDHATAVELERADFTLAELLRGDYRTREVSLLRALQTLMAGVEELIGEHGLGPSEYAAEDVAFEYAGEDLRTAHLEPLEPRYIALERLVEEEQAEPEEWAAALLSDVAGWLDRSEGIFDQQPDRLADFVADLAGRGLGTHEINEHLAELKWRTEVHARTAQGKVRPYNEDRYFVCEQRVGDPAAPSAIALACDGMGGHAAGDIAATQAARFLGSMLTSHAHTFYSRKDHREDVQEYVDWVVQRLREIEEQNPETEGMGTTVTGGLAVGSPGKIGADSLVINLGDSRTYLVNAEGPHRVTVDHSRVQQLVEQGRISKEEARSHPQSNVVTRCLGAFETDRTVDTYELELGGSEMLMACSDGLTDMVRDREIAKHLRESESAEEFVDTLLEAANAAGGKDNITVSVLVGSWVVPVTGSRDSAADAAGAAEPGVDESPTGSGSLDFGE